MPCDAFLQKRPALKCVFCPFLQNSETKNRKYVIYMSLCFLVITNVILFLKGANEQTLCMYAFLCCLYIGIVFICLVKGTVAKHIYVYDFISFFYQRPLFRSNF